MAARRGDYDERYDDDYEAVRGARSARRRPPRTRPARERKKAPLLLRFLSWVGVILLCFVAGYLGTSWMMRFLSTRFLLKPEGNVENAQDLKEFEARSRERERALEKGASPLQGATVRLYHPEGGGLKEVAFHAVSSVQEENIRDSVLKLLSLSGPEVAGKNVELRHVFRKADTVFLDFSDSFASALSALGAQSSSLLITGIVRTLRDNFPPIDKVRFLINSRVTNSGAPVDLTVPWQLPN
ncbi:MAG: GerMN domain-containing protein [Fretibacterium sp.]|nr:GerMN domain-containing protein [Fretibacterium sp.]